MSFCSLVAYSSYPPYVDPFSHHVSMCKVNAQSAQAQQSLIIRQMTMSK
jgi:hypothetical protein